MKPSLVKFLTLFTFPGDTERAATYCHSTLQRQLQSNQFNPMEWALNAASLSQYYITKVGDLNPRGFLKDQCGGLSGILR